MKEIESKNTLCSREDFRKLLVFLGLDGGGEEIENFYLDSPDRDLRKVQRMLRLRKTSGWKITIKGPAQRENDVFTREESEFTVDAETVRQILDNGRVLGTSGIIAERAGLSPESSLVVVAHCRVIRHVKRRDSMEIALDHVFLDDGFEYFELEVEAKSAEASRDYTKELLKNTRVCAQASMMSKYAYSLQHTKA